VICLAYDVPSLVLNVRDQGYHTSCTDGNTVLILMCSDNQRRVYFSFLFCILIRDRWQHKRKICRERQGLRRNARWPV